jgi:hypothetical protein
MRAGVEAVECGRNNLTELRQNITATRDTLPEYQQAVAMSTYETSATVEDQGRVHVAGVPFAPGTEVEVTITPKARPEDEGTQAEKALAAARDRMRELFRTVTGFRNSPRIPREELYERGRVH